MGKNKNKTLALLLIGGIACQYLTGCGPNERTEPLGSGYEEVVYIRQHISEPESHQITLQYRGSEGRRVMVWASIYNAIVKNDVAVFIGHDVNYDSKLFTVKAPELPMDITSEVLRRWSQSSGKDFAEALKFGNVGFIHDNGTTIQVTFTFWGQKYETWPREFQLDSKMISEIMHDVKGKGVVRKTSVYGKSYSFLEKEVKPEVQK